jgi:hypothetical protein
MDATLSPDFSSGKPRVLYAGPDEGLSGWPEVSRNPVRGAGPTADEYQPRRQPRMSTCPPQLFAVVVKSLSRKVRISNQKISGQVKDTRYYVQVSDPSMSKPLLNASDFSLPIRSCGCRHGRGNRQLKSHACGELKGAWTTRSKNLCDATGGLAERSRI